MRGVWKGNIYKLFDSAQTKASVTENVMGGNEGSDAGNASLGEAFGEEDG